MNWKCGLCGIDLIGPEVPCPRCSLKDNEDSGDYWWCLSCMEKIDPISVTSEERCDFCGNSVTYIHPDKDGVIVEATSEGIKRVVPVSYDELQCRPEMWPLLVRQISILKAENTKQKKMFLDALEREGRLGSVCIQWYSEWETRNPGIIPDLLYEKAVYDAGRAILDPDLKVEDLPNTSVEEAVDKIMKESKRRDAIIDSVDGLIELIDIVKAENTNLHQELDKAKEVIANAARIYGKKIGRNPCEKEVAAVVDSIVREGHCISWMTTDEQEAAKLDVSLRDNEIAALNGEKNSLLLQIINIKEVLVYEEITQKTAYKTLLQVVKMIEQILTAFRSKKIKYSISDVKETSD